MGRPGKNNTKVRRFLLGTVSAKTFGEKFGYRSLYETATEFSEKQLVAEDIDLFKSFDTENFEFVMSALATSRRVAEALGLETKHLEDRTSSIREALISAVHAVHIPRNMIDDAKLGSITKAMQKYESIYITNYDLICYWALMQDPAAFVDFFFSGQEFDITNTEVRGERTKMHFLHGGLHLYRRPTGEDAEKKS